MARRIKALRKIVADSLVVSKFVLPLHRNQATMVPWMSGLVSGLQNRVRRFESARNLKETSETAYNKAFRRFFFFGGAEIRAEKLI